ncbi:Naphthalene 1,2-dioxygenase system ferredoxin subunit [Ephemeroptericola cinctiostellae]|uniref:Naphthalene 1,2-dioxygenase system ferredoxin subunit n=1 Tax=Ephemeroptericola cinctiostellae TaxID=2268024 RepID=A0A345DC72_9BURK|nr:nitrite reductase small subunit NirD [Ephemeroptericola cinctiostellae]AXF85960.1 Naphthalene 1,2-dioxygenase system ferredoxin subunit [Ephemeroptericola cinctiostellae]
MNKPMNEFEHNIVWAQVATVSDFPEDGGMCVQVENQQIAIFNFARRGEWYATDNLCPHKQQMALSRGMIGSHGADCEPKVACPFHKKTFSLKNGQCLSGDDLQIQTYPVKVEGASVFVGLVKP